MQFLLSNKRYAKFVMIIGARGRADNSQHRLVEAPLPGGWAQVTSQSDVATFRWFSGGCSGGSKGRTERASVLFFAGSKSATVAGQKDVPPSQGYCLYTGMGIISCNFMSKYIRLREISQPLSLCL